MDNRSLTIACCCRIVDGLHRQYRVVRHGDDVVLDVTQTGDKGVLLHYDTLAIAYSDEVAYEERTHISDDESADQVANSGRRSQAE